MLQLLQSTRAKALLLPLLLPLPLRLWPRRDLWPLPWASGPWTSAGRKERPGLNSDSMPAHSSQWKDGARCLMVRSWLAQVMSPAQPEPANKVAVAKIALLSRALPHLLVHCPQRPSCRPADVRLLEAILQACSATRPGRAGHWHCCRCAELCHGH